jgi:hypothetical protein
MPRTIKKVKTQEGNEVEVYADQCNVCSTEMMFPKAEADRLEELFPFLREKINSGTPCVDCAKKKEESESGFKVFNQDEIDMVKKFITGNN